MKVKFLGGADLVGKLGMLVENQGANLMFEYGMRLVKPEMPHFPLMPEEDVEGVFITHSHLDHSGAVPLLVQRKDCEVFCNELTMDIATLLFFDSIKIAKSEGYTTFPYKDTDIKQTWQNFSSFYIGETRSIGGLEILAHNAGHIPGAQMYEIKGHDTTLFTGDLHTENTRLTYGAKPVKCDNLIIEATYAGRNHPPRPKSEALLQQKVREVVERGGTAIIPCFAVGRMQEVMMVLKDLPYDMWVDGMGKTVNSMYTDHQEHPYLRNIREFKAAKRSFNPVRTSSAREKARHGQVIITTSGMLDGGPVLHYLKDQKDNDKSAVMLVGYQAENSNGRLLKEQGRVESIQDGPMKIRCEVMTFDLSAHADHDQLLGFIKGCQPEKVVLMHSDSREELAQDLEGDYEVHLPMPGEYFDI